MLHAYNEGTAAIQTDTHNVTIDHSGCDKLLNLSSPIPINGLGCDSRQVVIWNERQVQVHSILESGVELVSDLQLDTVKSVSMSKDNLFILSGNSLIVVAIDHTRHVIEFSNYEGQPQLCDINMNNDLVVVTSKGFLKVFDVKDPDLMVTSCPSFNLHELLQGIDPIGEIFSVKCNANASLISIASKHDRASRLFVYNTLTRQLKLIQSDNSAHTLFHCWDPAEPRLLGYGIGNDSFTTLYFVDEEGGGIYKQETIHHLPTSRLIGVDAPYVLFAQEDGKVYNQTMTWLTGLEGESPLVLAAVIDFSFYCRIGDVDKGMEALQAVKSPQAWLNLAPICISMRRLDLVNLCLSHIASQEGLAAFELAQKEQEVECAFAFAAIQFGLYDTAKEFYIECNRHDLLNQLLQKLGQWDDAMKVAEGDDRLHLDLTRYNFARSLESKGDLDVAMSILSNDAKKSAKFKQLVQERRLDELEYFVSQQNEKDLYSWLGDYYFMSLNDHVKACDYYALAGNDLKLVELYCNEGNFDAARGVVDEGGNAAAAHFLARFYTGQEAVHLYTMGGLFNHAIRVAMSDGLDSELLELAQKCNAEQSSACAHYFEKKGLLSDACKLYAKSDQKSKALSLCLAILDEGENTDATDVLVSIVKESKEIPSDLSEKILQQLQQAGEKDLMLDVMCSNAKDPQTCLRFCSEHNVQLTQDVASKMLLLCVSEEEKHELLHTIAEKSFEQRNYLLASDLYSRCGETKLALKCLVKTGNPGAIISYANQMDSKSVYALSASSLQKLDVTSEDDTVAKSIIQFLTAAEKHNKLCTYLISQSQSCVEQRGDYETAVQYLKDASSITIKLNGAAAKEIKRLIGERVSTIEWFQYAQETYKTMDQLSLEDLCHDLISPQSNQIIRAGDCFALLVNYFTALEQYQSAYDYLQAMQERGLDPYDFIERSSVKKILQSVGSEGSSDDEST